MRLWGSFALLVAALVGIGALGLAGMSRARSTLRSVADQRWVRVRASQAAMEMVNANLQSRLTLFLVRDARSVDSLLAMQSEQTRRISALYARVDTLLLGDTVLSPGLAAERALFDTVKVRRAQYLERFAPARDMLRAGQREEAAAAVTATVLPRAAAYLAAWTAFIAYQGAEVDRAARAAEASYESVRRTTLLALALAVIAALLVAAATTRSVTRPLAMLTADARRVAAGDLTVKVDYQSADELGELADAFRRMADALRALLAEIDRGANEVAATSSELAGSAQEVMAAAEQVAASANVLAASATEQTDESGAVSGAAAGAVAHANRVAEHADETGAAANAMAAAAALAAEHAAAALAGLRDIRSATAEATPIVSALASKADEVNAVTRTVEKISRQTKLLALNAAIEAARAGEHGKGFAVVAEEVKTLAAGSAAALEDIRRILSEMRESSGAAAGRMAAVHDHVANGESIISQSATLLGEIANHAERSRTATAGIVHLAGEQREQAATVARHVDDIANVAQSNAAAAQQMSAVVQEQTAAMAQVAESSQALAGIAARLRAMTAQFVTDEAGSLVALEEAAAEEGGAKYPAALSYEAAAPPPNDDDGDTGGSTRS